MLANGTERDYTYLAIAEAGGCNTCTPTPDDAVVVVVAAAAAAAAALKMNRALRDAVVTSKSNDCKIVWL
jgi:hypothetical protein